MMYDLQFCFVDSNRHKAVPTSNPAHPKLRFSRFILCIAWIYEQTVFNHFQRLKQARRYFSLSQTVQIQLLYTDPSTDHTQALH